MALTAEMHLRYAQQLNMTPQLMQSIKLLAMTGVELERFVAQEIERNPLLDFGSKTNIATQKDRISDIVAAKTQEQSTSLLGEELTTSHFTQNDTSIDKAIISDNVYDSSPKIDDIRPPEIRSGFGFNDNHNSDIADFEQFISAPISLRAHIEEQILFQFHNPIDSYIARDLSEQIDESGYFIGDCEETALRLHQPSEKVVAILHSMQGFDPVGIFACNLSECLALQLKEKNRYDPAMAKLLMHLDDLAKRDFVKLKRICGVDEEDLAEMLREIRALDPKPGLVFSTAQADIVVPDVIVTQVKNDFRVELNQYLLPKVLINKDYSNVVCSNKADQDFFSQALQNAHWLIKALDQRANTLLLVVSEIVRQQRGFFRHGIHHLKPLSMTVLAQKIGLHESTISRVISNKYVSTPRGMFNLRFFFTSAIAAADGSAAHSSEAVRHRIRQFINEELPDAILSDDTLVDYLKKEGIDIARRTVAKYREAMNIPSSVARRRDKKNFIHKNIN